MLEKILVNNFGSSEFFINKAIGWILKDENGNISGIWGAMSDFSRSFQPWEDFSKGLYLAGVECNEDAEAPDGWTKWVILHKKDSDRCYGIIADEKYLMVFEYSGFGADAEIVVS